MNWSLNYCGNAVWQFLQMGIRVSKCLILCIVGFPVCHGSFFLHCHKTGSLSNSVAVYLRMFVQILLKFATA